MFEPGGHLGLDQEPPPALGVGGALVLETLDGDGAVQRGVRGAEHFPDPASGVWQEVAVRSCGGAEGNRHGMIWEA